LLCYLWLTTPEPGISMANFRRLRPGMTEEAVIAAFGRPGDKGPGFFTQDPNTEIWTGGPEDAIISLTFDPEGLLIEGTAWVGGRPGEALQRSSFLNRLRRLLPR
jgi:hypothetical protein